ncbi:MAG TPA: hypothetical protein VME19_05725 [Streptosporangiaceae bacterium]|nr:hypothetical protein [Streptosporangiaceae bacterium]
MAFRQACTANGNQVINRADFGLTWNLLGLTSMNNTLTIRAVFTRR